ncbi:MAG: recombinase family protein [Actinomycetota bacterium]
MASQDGWKLVCSYSDQMSGKTLERPGLRRALADAKDGSYDLLLVFKVDRLARSVGGLAKILEGLDACGVSFRSASEPFDTSTAAGRMMVQMLGVFAEFEREMIVERTKLGLAKKASKGEWTGGTPPFGYRYVPERRMLVPVPGEARVVTEIFESYVERRSGSVAVSNWLNDSRRVTRRGSRWTPKTVLDVLRNATYTGKLPFNGDLYDAKHEPIVDAHTFERAQKLLEMRAESLPSRAANASDYLLTGLLTCARCGHGFIGTAAHGRGGVYRYYTCFSRQRHGTARCDQERIPAESLEEAIVAEALAALDDGSIFFEAARMADEARAATRADEVAERRELSAEVAAKRGAVDRYLRAFETGELPPSACGHRVEELHKEIEVLESRRAALEAEVVETTAALSANDLARLKREIGAALLGAGPEQVKELLSVVVSEICVEGRSSIQPFFVAPGVRMPAPQRRRTGHYTHPLVFPAPGLTVAARSWSFV